MGLPAPDRPADADADSEAWIREAARLHARYVVEIVEGFELCPWSPRARTDGRLRTHVSLQRDARSIEAPLAALDRWASDADMEVGFVLFPRLDLARAAFETFVTRVRSADSDRSPLGSAPFAMVGFHPEATARMEDGERLIPFLRRAPDPCIQAIRIDVLERVRGNVPEGTQFLDIEALEAAATGVATPTVRDRVCRANLETARRVGVEAMTRALDAIREDRNATYRALEHGRSGRAGADAGAKDDT